MPPTFEGINLGIAFFQQLQRHTGTGMLVTSGAVKNNRVVRGVVVPPKVYIVRVSTHSSGNFII
jgi:hypothetical protein